MRALLAALLALAALPPAAAANELYAVNQGSDDLSVIDTDAAAVVGTVALGSAPFAVAVTPDGARAYVTGPGGVTVVDTATRTVAARIDAGGPTTGVAVTPDGTRVYAAGGQPGTVTVIATATDSVVDRIAVDAARAVAVAPDGERVYVTSMSADTVTVIDAATGMVATTVPVGAEPVAVTVTPDGRRLYVASAFGSLFGGADVSVIDTATDAVVQSLTFSFAFAIGAAPTGDRVFVASDLLGSIAVGGGLAAGSVVVANGLNSIAVAPDGGRAYLPSNAVNTVSVVDTAAMSVLQAIGVGSRPMGVALRPEPGPTAAFTAAGDDVTAFDARPSSDPDRAIARYDWDFGDGTRALDGGPSVTHVYAAPGSYHVSVTVTNGAGCSTAVVFTGQTAACNGGPKATATRTVTVGTPAPPICDGDSVAVAHATATAVALACRGEVSALRIVAGPRNGRLSALDQQDGTVVYTPDAGSSGADRIRFAADGPGGSSNVATIAVTVGAAERAADRSPPRTSRVRLTRRSLRLRVSERATLAITISRCRVTGSGGDRCRTVRRLGRSAGRARTLRVRVRPRLHRGRHRVTVRAVDAAGNRSRTSVFRRVR